MNAPAFSLRFIYKVLFFLLLSGAMSSGLGINNTSTVNAQKAVTETPTVLPRETASPLVSNQLISPQIPDHTKDSVTNQIILKYKSTAGKFISPDQVDQMNRLSTAAELRLQFFRNMSGDAMVLRLNR